MEEKSNKKKPLEKHIEEFSTLICKICESTEKSSILNQISKYFKEKPIVEDEEYRIKLGRVWILIGKRKEDSKYVALQIGQSEDIKKEIQNNITHMFNTILDNIDEHERRNKIIYLTQKEFEYKKGENKVAYLYRHLKRDYSNLKFYEVDIDKYLNINNNNQILDISYHLSKDYVAESKLAAETEPYYWNYYHSGVGKRAYFYFVNNSI